MLNSHGFFLLPLDKVEVQLIFIACDFERVSFPEYLLLELSFGTRLMSTFHVMGAGCSVISSAWRCLHWLLSLPDRWQVTIVTAVHAGL